MDLGNKTALVTGSTGKLTRVVCEALARAGMNMALHYHSNDTLARELKRTVEELGRRCGIYAFDLATPDGCESLAASVLKDFGGVDVLIHSAAVFEPARLAATDDRRWQKHLDLNVTAAFRMARALEATFRTRDGAIVMMADIWGLRPKSGFLAYSVSKAALIALTKALAEEFAPRTTVNAVAPGIIDFPDGFPDSIQDTVLGRVPTRRPGRHEEVAAVIVEILKNRYLTGQVIAVDGGRSLM